MSHNSFLLRYTITMMKYIYICVYSYTYHTTKKITIYDMYDDMYTYVLLYMSKDIYDSL